MTISIVDNMIESDLLICEQLAISLADTAIETVKAQNYHWNVAGPAFEPLHELFQKIYEDHFEAQDALAERIKALGGHVDGRYSVFLTASSIAECHGLMKDREMVSTLANDQETLSASLRLLAKTAEEHNDAVTNDLAIERAGIHDKFAWMLRAHLRG